MNDQIAGAIESARLWQPGYNIFTQIEDVDSVTAKPGGPLSGVPIAIKDLIDHAGRVTTLGSAFYRDIPTTTATSIQRLEEAGAVVVGRTGLHEFAFGFSSENPHFGPVHNPWDPETSPGGSSGGSGAAVGAGIVPLAIGTDTGGSVRVPAALCGCYGLKVTYGKIPLDGVFPLVPSIDTVGPLAGSIKLLDLAYRAMSLDTSVSETPGNLRIGIPRPWFEMAPLAPAVARAFELAVGEVERLGHEVRPVEMPDVFPDRPINFAIAAEVVAIHRDYREKGLTYGSEVATRLDEAFTVTPEQIGEGRAWQAMIRARMSDAFATVDLLMTPTVAAMRKAIGIDEIDGTPYRKVLSWFSSVVNHALVPAIAMPLAGTGRPPVSLQLIGPSDSEPLLLELGRQLEDAKITEFVSAELRAPAPQTGN
ncbi:MAG TPA: amidase [Acidimicrobiia bacterium]